MARCRHVLGAALAALAVGATSCGGDGEPADATTFAAAAGVAALAPLPDGGLRVGERTTGRVLEFGADGGEPIEVATVDVATAEQRGLVGVAVDGSDRTYAAWVRPDDLRLVVAQVAPGPVRLVWEGPVTQDRANGGHLEVAPDGMLLIGIGDLLEPDAVADPAAPNGKLLRLDPDGPAGQTPEVVSGGWNNPFAFDVAPGGAIWVADNEPGSSEERLTRGDEDGPVTFLPDATAPSGLAAVDDRTLLVCGYVSGTLTRWEIADDGTAALTRTLADDCRLGVGVLADGRVVYTTETEVRVLPALADG